MKVALPRENRNWQGARLREACDRDATTGFKVRSRAERTIVQAHSFVDATFEPDEARAVADNEHSQLGDQLD